MNPNPTSKHDNISIVVPVYNSYETLPELVERLVSVLPDQCAEFEIILVNDGSRDLSWEVICQLANKHSAVRGIDLMRNYGQHNAVLCGIRAAQFSVIVTMDDDLQHSPEEIPRLLNKLEEGFDVVYGAPERQRHSAWRALASYLTRLALQMVMGISMAHHISAFRAFRANLRRAFRDFNGYFVSIDALLSWGTSRFGVVLVEHRPRLRGESNYNFVRLVTQAVNIILGFSTLPLRFVSALGIALFIFGVLVLVYVIGRYFAEGFSVPGFPFLASIIAIFSGAQLFALGVIGEYLTRMYFRALDRPTYVIAEEIGSKEVTIEPHQD